MAVLPPSPPGASPAGPAMGQPPTGSSPATGPTPNLGYQAAGQAKLALVVKQLESMLPLFGASSEPGQDILESIKRLSKHVPPGSVAQPAQNNMAESMMLRQQQMAPMLAAQKINQPAPQPQPQAA